VHPTKRLDEDLLSGVFVSAKSRAIVRRAAILDFLPSGLNDDWPYSGYIFGQSIKTHWDMELPPTVLRGHNVWIIAVTQRIEGLKLASVN
jgi:hypothetical protein